MAFDNIDKLPLGNLLQSEQGSRKLAKKRKKSLGRIKKLREKGYK